MFQIVGHQTWIRHGRVGLINTFCGVKKNAGRKFEVDFFGTKYEGDLGNWIDWNVFFFGAYARHELNLLKDIANSIRMSGSPQVDFFDIGANVGNHSIFMCNYANMVYSFEPFPVARQELERKVKRNEIKNIVIYPLGLGENDQDLDYFAPHQSNLGSGSFAGRPDNFSGLKLKLPIRQGDKFFQDMSLPTAHIIKIDVEGFEPSVLRGLSKVIRSDRPVMLLELSEMAKTSFMDEHGLMNCLYEECAIFGVRCKTWGGNYLLKSFQFDLDGEILVAPIEKMKDLSVCVKGIK
jgi:FkbM family methyltransferase